MGRKKIQSATSAQVRQHTDRNPNPETDGSQEQQLPHQNEQWLADMAVLRRAAEELTRRRTLARMSPDRSRERSSSDFAESLDYSSESDRNQAVRAFYEDNPDRAASLFTVALREGSPEQRRQIGAALVGSGLVDEAISRLTDDRNENTYSAFSLLFLAAKSGEIEPLIQVIENHTSLELRIKLIGLLVSSGEAKILSVFRRLAVNKTFPVELRSAIVEAINQLNSGARETAA